MEEIHSYFDVQYTEHKESFPQHIKNTDSAIKFTVEDTRVDSSMPFLGTLVTPQHNGILTTSV